MELSHEKCVTADSGQLPADFTVTRELRVKLILEVSSSLDPAAQAIRDGILEIDDPEARICMCQELIRRNWEILGRIREGRELSPFDRKNGFVIEDGRRKPGN